jgi:cryptochrome
MRSAVHWFRKGLRLHDNPALLEAIDFAHARQGTVYPIFCLDVGYYVSPAVVGVNRMQFLLQTLADLDRSLRARNSRLYLLRGNPIELLPRAAAAWDVGLVTFESDCEPYAKVRDPAVQQELTARGVSVRSFATHTLYDPAALRSALTPSKPFPKSLDGFIKLLGPLGPPAPARDAPTVIPTAAATAEERVSELPCFDAIPRLDEIGFPAPPPNANVPPGGESAAIQRMETQLRDVAYIRGFAKPQTSPCSLSPSTTLLSPYLKFGSLSPRLFYYSLCRVMGVSPEPRYTPESLLGQLLWREFFTMSANFIPHFGQQVGNPICRQIPWSSDPALFQAWADGRTGYPWIDSLMRQLRQEGWMHHLGRHCVACFLTRGDLWQSWERGRDHFDVHLVDADWALNSANWYVGFFFLSFFLFSSLILNQSPRSFFSTGSQSAG